MTVLCKHCLKDVNISGMQMSDGGRFECPHCHYLNFITITTSEKPVCQVCGRLDDNHLFDKKHQTA